MSATGDQAGFTLIEALVVVGIAALIAGIIFPGVERTIGDWQYRQAQVSVRVGLLRARSAALGNDAPARFAPSDDGRGFQLSGAAPVALASGVRVAADRPVLFFPDGSASGGRVVVSGTRAGQRRSFTVSETGLIGVGG